MTCYRSSVVLIPRFWGSNPRQFWLDYFRNLSPTNARFCNLCKLSVIYLLLFIAAHFNGNFGGSSKKMATVPKQVTA
jgi:hypothetical protein